MAEATERQAHSAEIKEIWKLFKETDKKFKKTEERFKETERILSEKFKETERILSEKFTESAEQFKETRALVNSLTGKWGKFVEGLVAPGAIRMFRERGVKIEQTYQRAEAWKDGEKMEIDVLCVNDSDILAIEVKSTLSVDDVNEHIERLNNFKRFFPQYRDKNLLGAVAGIVFDGAGDKYAYRQGLFVIGQTGETVHILNDDQFKPRLW